MQGRDDKRRYHRARIPGIVGSLSSPGDVAVKDVSLTGLGVETTVELDRGQRCFLELKHETRKINVEAEVRWASAHRVQRDVETLRPVFRVGLAFVDILREDEGGIWDYLVVEPLDPVEPPETVH